MTIYKVEANQLQALPETTFSNEKIRERDDLQRMLRKQIEVVSPDTLIIAEEFGEFEGVRRRIDLLGIDKAANLVVIELKRTEDGGHMELQAIRYAAMISAMTFDRATEVFRHHLKQIDDERDARDTLLEFLEWEDASEEDFAQDVRIVLASAEFSKELTASVLWLNERNLDISCYRLKPYKLNNEVFLDVQKIIPLPETAEYQVQIREKKQSERTQKASSKDLTKFVLFIDGQETKPLSKRQAIFRVVKQLCDSGVTPEQIQQVINWRGTSLWRSAEGKMDATEFEEHVTTAALNGGPAFESRRWFYDDQELIYSNGRTWAMTKMWGERTEEAMKSLLGKFPNFSIRFQAEK